MDTTLAYLASPEPELIRGLPELDRECLALMTSQGHVVVARHDKVTTYRREGLHCNSTHDVEFREPITALAESRAGLVVATGGHIHLVEEHGSRELACVDGTVRSIAVTATSIYAAVGRPGRLDGTLVEFDLLRSAIVSERSIRSAAVTLTSDVTGSYLGIADGTTFRTVRTAHGQPCPENPRDDPPRSAPVDDPCGCHDKGPGKDAEPIGVYDPTSPPTDRHPPSEPCDPGQSGVPTPGGGRIIGDGGGVTKHPPGPGRPWNPCGLRVFFEVHQVQLAGAYVIAADREARHVAVLASHDLSMVHQSQYRRGAVVLSHPANPGMLIFDRGTRSWEHKLFDRFERVGLESEPAIDLRALDEPMTWVGAPMNVLRGDRARAVGVKRVLVIPALDPNQAFNDADLPKLAAYFKRAGFSHVQSFYRENSFGELTNIEFVVHGVDAGSGGPVRLPKPIADYYQPAYVGAHVDLVKSGVTFPATLVFDGRERMTLSVQPQTGGRPPSTLNLKFNALLAVSEHKDYPAQVRFAGTETAALTVKHPSGANVALALKFTAKTVNIENEAVLSARLGELETYLEGIVAAAESAAFTPPLFAKPVLRRVDQGTKGPGLLITTLSNVSATGPRLEVSAISYTGAQDPLGFQTAIPGRMIVTAASAGRLGEYLNYITLLAQEEAGFNNSARRLAKDPDVAVDVGAGKLTSTITISKEDGGPGATMSVKTSVEMGTLFDSATSVANTNVTAGRSNTPKEGNDGFDGLISDVFTSAVDRLAPPGKHLEKKADIEKFFGSYEAVIVGIVHPAASHPTDPEFVRPDEMWNAGPSSWKGRAVEAPRTAVFRPHPKEIQFFSNWNLVPFSVKPDYPLFCHEFGHALGFDDLYDREAGYRDDLIFMAEWAMMHKHPFLSHHCGFHKWQAGWITDKRIETIGRPKEDETLIREVLLVPVEHWHANDALVGAARAAFGKPQLPVVQLVELDLGGGADIFGLIEARQKGVEFSDNLPFDPAVLVTNCVVWWDKTRYAFNGKYRAPVHLLHEGGELRKAGDSFDLAKGKELPVKGIVVSIIGYPLKAGQVQDVNA